jgi:hypothetical protein
LGVASAVVVFRGCAGSSGVGRRWKLRRSPGRPPSGGDGGHGGARSPSFPGALRRQRWRPWREDVTQPRRWPAVAGDGGHGCCHTKRRVLLASAHGAAHRQGQYFRVPTASGGSSTGVRWSCDGQRWWLCELRCYLACLCWLTATSSTCVSCAGNRCYNSWLTVLQPWLEL